MLKDGALDAFWPALKQLTSTGPVVLVHGGGPQATAMARRLGHEPTIVNGRRVTSDLDLSIVHWTLCGALNKQLVAKAQQQGINAAGISGIDGGILKVHKRPPWHIDGRSVDFGWVGDVDSVDPGLLTSMLDNDFTPIVAPLGIDAHGHTYNVNADTVAHAIAVALRAKAFLLVTESGGVRRNAQDATSRIEQMDERTYDAGASAGWIKDGMLVKLKMAFEALDSGIKQVFILSPDDIVRRSQGTEIVQR